MKRRSKSFVSNKKMPVFTCEFKCQTVKIQSPCTLPTCWPRSCFRRGCVLHIARCFFIPLTGWRIKLLLSFDAYFCFVTNSLRKKKQTNNTIQKDFVSLLQCIMASRHTNLSAVRTETLQCNTCDLYYWTASLQSFPSLSISPYIQGKKKNPATFLNITFSIMLRMK